MNDYIEMHALYHHGIKGQKWGIRRFQNDDGTLTDEGRARYGVDATGRMSERGRLLYDSDRQREETRKSNKVKKIVIGVSAAAMAAAITAGALWYRNKMKRKALASKAGKASAASRAKHKAAGETFLKGYFKGVVRSKK